MIIVFTLRNKNTLPKHPVIFAIHNIPYMRVEDHLKGESSIIQVSNNFSHLIEILMVAKCNFGNVVVCLKI